MNKVVFAVWAAVWSAGVRAEGWPDPTVTDPTSQRRAEEMARGFQGAYVVAQDGVVLAAGGAGLANRTTGEQNGIRTKFRLASVTKPLTAVAILQLAERGELSLSDKVTAHVPDYGRNGDRITIAQLLSHGSGIPDYVSSVGEPSSPTALIDAFKGWGLRFTPGSSYEYSNSNFALLGYVIEKVSGLAYEDYVERHVFTPARMEDAGFAFPRRPGAGFAAPSGGDPDGPWEPNAKAYAAGALYASVADMVAFNHALYNGYILSDASVRLMQTRQNGSYGYGFFVNEGRASHSGQIPGFTSMLHTDRAGQRVVMVFANGSSVAGGLASRLRELVYPLHR